MRKKGWLITLLLGLTVCAAAQSTRVRGIVKDAQTGEPLPFVGVYFDGTTIGISTDLDGRYSLETRSKDAKILTAQLIGYENSSVEVRQGAFSEINFSLRPDPKQLNAALVKPDDRYIKSILRKLDKARSTHDPDNAPDWESRLYSKVEMDITNMEDFLKLGFMNRNLGFVREYSDTSSITGKAYIPAMISENVSDVYHSQNPSFNREVMRASRISGLDEDNLVRQFTGSYFMKTNFYKSTIGLFNLDLPNPAAAGTSSLFYNYFLVDSLQVENRKTYVLRFHPKKLVTSPTFDGEMQIDAEDFGIRSVHARLSEASNVNWIRHINVDIENQRLPDGRWFYGDETLFIDFSISVSDSSKLISLLGNRHMSYSPPVFRPVQDPDALTSKNPVVMRDVPSRDADYWDQARPYKLTEREQGIFDMVERFKQQPFYKWTYGIVRALTVNYIEVVPNYFEFGRWARTFAFNNTEGLRVQLGGRTMINFSKKLRLGGYIGLGLKDLVPKYQLTAEYMLGREKTRKLTLDIQKDYIQFSSGTGIFTAQNMFSSILVRDHTNRQSMMFSAALNFDYEFHPQVNALFQLRHYRIWNNDIVPFIRPDGSVLQSFSVNQFYSSFRFSAKDQRVSRNYFTKTYMFTKYPVLDLDFTGALKGITPDDVGYIRASAALEWKTPSNAIGFGRLKLEAGAVFGSVPFQLLKLHEGNQTFFLDRSAAACMDYYEFLSDRWVTGYYEHNFNGFFLGKIPLIKKLDLREVATVRFAWGTISPDNKENAPLRLPEGAKTLEKPYVEVGVGISNILRILRVDAFWRLTHRRPEGGKNFTVNLGVDVDF